MKVNKNNNQISFNKPGVDKKTFEKEINSINERVKDLEENGVGGGGEGLTAEQRRQLREAYEYSQLDHVEQEEFDEMNETIDKILGIIDKPPSYSRPSFSLSLSTSRVEHNTATIVTISPRFSRNDGGEVTSYELRRNSVVLQTGTTTFSYTDSIRIAHNNSLTYSATITYADGAIKNTSLGVPYPSTSIKAGSLSSSASISAYAPSFYGVISGNTISESNISRLTKTVSTSRSNTITLSLNNERIVFMYPRNFGNLTSIKDANNFDYINSYTRSEMIYNEVQYNVYILTDPITISGFRQAFS
jgi:hypothetical protein